MTKEISSMCPTKPEHVGMEPAGPAITRVDAARCSPSIFVDDDGNGDYDNDVAGDLEYNKDSWQSLLLKENKAVVGGGGSGSFNGHFRSILIAASYVACLVVASYALGIKLGSVIRSSGLNDARDDAKYIADGENSTSIAKGMSTIDSSLMTFLAESSTLRARVVDLIIDDLTVPNGVCTERSDRFENAMEAMHLLETDGESIPMEGYPFLFVGSIGENKYSVLFIHFTFVKQLT
jgi:hypothetical protein